MVLKLLMSLSNIILTKYLVELLGSDVYGVFRSATAATALVSLTEAGLSGAAFGLIIRYVSQRDQAKTSEVVSHTVRIFLLVFISIVLLSWPAGRILSVIYRIPQLHQNDFTLAVCFYCIATACGFLSAPFIWVIQASRKEYILNLFILPLILASPFVTYGLARYYRQAYGASLGVAVIAVAGVPLAIGLSLFLHRWLKINLKSSSNADVRQRTKYAFLEQIGSVLSAQALTWSISVNFGLKGVATVLLTQTFFAFSRDFFGILANNLLPTVGATYHEKDYARTHRIWLESIIFSVSLSAIVASSICIYNGALVTTWLGAEHFAGQAISLLFAASFLIYGFSSVNQSVLYSIDGVKERAFCVFGEAVGGIVLCFIFARAFGPAGAIGGLVFSQLATALIYPFLIQQKLGTASSLLPNIVRLLTCQMGAALLVWQLVHPLRFTHFWQPCAATAGTMFLLGIVAFYLGLNHEHRSKLKFRIAHLLPQGRPLA
jgi:O-antigen/teichoic acid export membrane protein